MKKLLLILLAAFMISGTLQAQDVDLGADVVSNYIWRGSKVTGPSIQPHIELGIGDLALGTWGSFALTGNDSSGLDYPAENDFYISYAIGDLSVGLTDYYYQGKFSEFSKSKGSHAVELNLGYTMGDLSLAANYIFNEAGGAGSAGKDKYFEASYSVLENLGIFVGAGDGWHSSDTKFAVVNVGVSASKEVKITDDFSLPVSGAVVYNPDKDVSYFYVGFSL